MINKVTFDERKHKRRLGSMRNHMSKDFLRNKYIYLMAIAGMAYYIIFHYIPMYGVIISFKDFTPAKGIIGSPWAGLKHYIDFFNSYYFFRILSNTLILNLYSLIWVFPAPIILALLINEIRNNKFKRLVQTVTYLPHFISLVVICGMIVDFTTQDGLINTIIGIFGGNKENLLLKSEYFRTIYIASEVWQTVGWGTIIYLAAITNIDSELYNAATVDGANRWKQTWHITLPGIMPTVVILLILRIGGMMNVGFEKIILLYNPSIYETADVISSFIYRRGILEASFSYSTAVGLFNSVVNFILLILANWISRRVNEESLW